MHPTSTDTKIHALFGSPIAHSLSPIIFNRTFEKQDVNRVYLPFDIGSNKLIDAVDAARALKFEGFNVTTPHKTRILDLLDRVDATAKEKGSVNTVSNDGTGLTGYDTDGEGAIRALQSYSFNPEGKRILIIGAGGSARALIHSIAPGSGLLNILNRNPMRAKEIADSIRGRTRIASDGLTKKSLEANVPKTDLLLNATPLQTIAILNRFNIKRSILKDVGWLFDLAYDKPQEEVPTKHGRISPLEMLLQQAALSYKIWLRKPAPLDLMRSAMTSHLGGDWR